MKKPLSCVEDTFFKIDEMTHVISESSILALEDISALKKCIKDISEAKKSMSIAEQSVVQKSIDRMESQIKFIKNKEGLNSEERLEAARDLVTTKYFEMKSYAEFEEGQNKYDVDVPTVDGSSFLPIVFIIVGIVVIKKLIKNKG